MAVMAPGSEARGGVAATLALSKAIVGAGMVAVPRAFLALGAAAGCAILVAVAGLVWTGMAVLVDGSAAHPAAAATYRGVARAACGRRVGLLAQASVILFCFGFVVVNLVVTTDLLRGTPPACNGLICLITGGAGGALESRAAVLLAVASMQRLTALNWAGVAAAAGLAALAAGLGASAVVRGVAHPLPLWPPHLAPDAPGGDRLAVGSWAATGGGGGRGGGGGGSGGGVWLPGGGEASQRHPVVAMVVDGVGVLAVVLTAYVAHQAVHPAMPLLQPYTPARMRAASGAALGLALALYLAFSVGACLAFGPGLTANALSSFSADALGPLLGGPRAGRAAAAGLQASYLLIVLSSLVLFVHPLRTAVAEMIWDGRGARGAGGGGEGGGGDPLHGQLHGDGGRHDSGGAWRAGGSGYVAAMEARHYLALTYSLLAAATLAAIAVPDVWQVLSVIGNGAASVEAFVVPGLIALALRRRRGGGGGGCPSTAAEEGGGGALSQHLLAAAGEAAAGAQEGGAAGGEAAAAAAEGRSLLRRAGAAWGAAAAWLLLALGAVLLANGAAQQLVALGLPG
ncbi:MAG: hypothetical protein J3K34DRAFT_518668 [Monoraphidium minutum]|nr:MAG: hypothetical protein J3K34DRAFT_518668 [Monoraphidium minutum]